MNPDHRPGPVGVEYATRILACLEPAAIVRVFHNACVELLGHCEVRVYAFAPDEETRAIRFGDDGDAKPINIPGFSGGGPGSALSIEGASPGKGWLTHVGLRDGDVRLGILEVWFDTPPAPMGLEALDALARILAVAVRNGQTFERTTRLTFTDDLTALYNSRFMSLYLEREVRRCRRMRSPLSLLFMDLDGFKSINDTHGHLAGSRTLVEVGAVLEKTVRDADVLIRYGGDEFVILFPETPLSGGLVIAERIRQVIAGTKFLESQQIDARVSASIGIAAYPESAEDVRGLIASADRAMYEAKALGKNRVIAARPLSSLESSKRP